MCGIVGILLADERSHANQLLFDALTALQHRGQGKINVLLMLARLIFQQLLITIAPFVPYADAAGITSCGAGRFHARKDNGLVKDVFQAKDMLMLTVSAAAAPNNSQFRNRNFILDDALSLQACTDSDVLVPR
jgi:amidophosphoribosyltransferase